MPRPVALVAATTSLAAALLAVPLAGTAAAAVCGAVAVPPHLEDNALRGSGSYRCTEAAGGMTITVCIEEWAGDLTVDVWEVRACETVTSAEPTDALDATAAMQIVIYSTYLRTTVTGTNERGEEASFTSPPLLWFNCACAIM